MSCPRLPMVRRCAAFAALLIAGVPTLQAQQTWALRVEPNPATAGTLLTARIDNFNRGCRHFLGSEVTRQGQVVTWTWRFVDLPCGTPPPSFGITTPLGQFEPGQYALVFIPIGQNFGALPSVTVGFQVTPGAPAPVTVPTAASWLLATMAGMLAALGALAQRRRRLSP